MTRRSARDLALLREDLEYHQARVLLLIAAVSTDPGHQRKLDGLTKLAKLDFLVRYPEFASVIFDDLDRSDVRLHLEPDSGDDRPRSEAPMTRYKYGPWDDRYYPIIGALVSRGLVKYIRGRQGNVALRVTPLGSTEAEALANDEAWSPVAERCQAIANASQGMTGNALKARIYDRLEEVMDRPHRTVIE
jgi:hypothetical protein